MNEIDIVIRARDEASRQLEQTGRQAQQALTQVERATATTTQALDRVDASMGRTARSVRLLAVPLVAELSPALGTTSQQIVGVVASAATLGTGLGAIAIAAIGLAGVLGGQLLSAWQANRKALDEYKAALASFDLGQITAQITKQRAEIEKLNKEITDLAERRARGGIGSGGLKTFEEEARRDLEDAIRRQRRARDIQELNVEEQGFHQGGLIAQRLAEQRAGRELELGRRLPVERQIEAQKTALALLEVERQLLGIETERANLANDEGRFLEVHRKLSGLIEREAEGLRKVIDLEAQLARTRAEFPQELQSIEQTRTEQRGLLGERTGVKFDSLTQAYQRGVLGIRERRLLPPSTGLEEAERAERGSPTVDELQRAERAVREADERGLSVDRERVQLGQQWLDIRLQAEGLSAKEVARLELERSFISERLQLAEVQLRVAQAHGTLGEESARELGEAQKILIQQEAAIQRGNIARAETLRTDAFAGLAEGFRQEAEEFEAVGHRMQAVAHDVASAMRQSFSDQFFSVITGDFKKLPDIGKQFTNQMLRSIADEFSSFVTGQAIGGVRALLGGGRAGIGGYAGGAAAVGASVAGGIAPAFAAAGGSAAYYAPAGGALAYQGVGQPGVAGTAYAAGPVGGVGGADSALGLVSPLVSAFAGTSYLGAVLSTPISLIAQVGFSQAVALTQGTAQGLALLAGDAIATSTGVTAASASAAAGGAAGSAGTSAVATTAGATVGSVLGAAAAGIGFLFALYGAYQSGSPTYGGISGAVSGLAAGAAIGGLVGGPYGVAVGAVIGLVAGGAAGAGAGAAGKGDDGRNRTRERSREGAERGAKNLFAAIQGVQTHEQLLELVNTLWSGSLSEGRHAKKGTPPWAHREVTISNLTPRTIDPIYGRRDNEPSYFYTAEDIRDRVVIDNIVVHVGETGYAQPHLQLTDALRRKMVELLEKEERAAQTLFGFTETLAGGAVSRFTVLPSARLPEAQGQDIVFSRELATAQGADDDQIEALMRRMIAVDRDRNVGMISSEELRI